MALSLAEKLALWKYLDGVLTALHKKNLVPTAQEDMIPTERMPATFGGKKVAAWVTLPKPRQPAAYVKDAAKLLAWAKVNYPAKVENPVEVIVDAGLIEFLQEHRPESLHVAERVDPQWTDDIRGALTEHGCYITATGEKLTEVPGIEVPEPVPSSPQVRLEKDAAEVIAAAWPQIQPALREVLALPAPQEASDAAASAPPPDDSAFFDAKRRSLSPELAALHAVTVQGGFSTPAREARRMLRDAQRAGDGEYEARVAAWLDERGLSHDGDEEAPDAP
jgi:hypothetical protein